MCCAHGADGRYTSMYGKSRLLLYAASVVCYTVCLISTWYLDRDHTSVGGGPTDEPVTLVLIQPVVRELGQMDLTADE